MLHERDLASADRHSIVRQGAARAEQRVYHANARFTSEQDLTADALVGGKPDVALRRNSFYQCAARTSQRFDRFAQSVGDDCDASEDD